MSTTGHFQSRPVVGAILIACVSLLGNTTLVHAACEEGQPSTGAVVDVKGTGHKLLQSPDPAGAPIINEKATRILGSTTYHTIDSTAKVRALCEDGDWVKVQIVEPKWLSHVVGWTQRENLALPRKPGEARTFTEDDVYWDDHTAPYKDILVKGINRIAREDSRCKDCLDPSSVALSPSKSQPGYPVFYVTCGSGLNAVNIFFTPEDVASPLPFSAPRHIDREVAIDLTEAYARKSALNPSTVRFSRIEHLGVIEHPNGRTTVLSQFTAKNALGVEAAFNIRCLIDDNGVLEGVITEPN